MHNIKYIIYNLTRVRVYLIVLIVAFFVSFCFGVFNDKCKESILSHGNNYCIFYNADASLFKNFFSKLASLLGLLIVMSLFSISIYTTPLQVLIVLYNGFMFGCIFSLTLSSSIVGIVFLLFFVIPSNLLSSASLILLSALGFASAINAKKCEKINFYELVLNFVFAFILVLISALWELIVLALIFKPLNLMF